jgi:selenide,water dikinase
MEPMEDIKLTQYSHGAGCGCKIAPAALHNMLQGMKAGPHHPSLLVGNDTKDDAAVVDLGDGTGIISTTDFFMPIVDDPHTFGRIAAANAISDIYAMGGTPLVAIAIFGWPIDKLSEEVGGRVLEGGRSICEEAGIPLAGGHSIDCPEPIFGLAVTGRVSLDRLQKNAAAHPGDVLFLTKPLGVGMVATAQKRGVVQPDHLTQAVNSMQSLNAIGAELSAINGVHAMTDVTGFGLMGHLLEMCEGSGTQAVIFGDKVQTLDGVQAYHEAGCVPGGARRNYASYGSRIAVPEGFTRDLMCDPQTSGGLLVSVAPESAVAVSSLLQSQGLPHQPLGCMLETSREGGATAAWVPTAE